MYITILRFIHVTTCESSVSNTLQHVCVCVCVCLCVCVCAWVCVCVCVRQTHSTHDTVSMCISVSLYIHTDTHLWRCKSLYSVLYMLYVGVYREGKSERKRRKEKKRVLQLLPPDLCVCISIFIFIRVICICVRREKGGVRKRMRKRFTAALLLPPDSYICISIFILIRGTCTYI